MARVSDVPPVVPSEPRKPFWLIPNLLSLDAPLVAVSWLYIFAKTWRVDYLPWSAYIALALVVWVIYIVDRLIDVSMREGSPVDLEPRHQFHRTHKRKFRILAVVSSVVAILLVTVPMKLSIFGHSFDTGLPLWLYSYAAIGGIMVAGFFTLAIFSNGGPNELPHGKNILAGMAFAYGTAILAYGYTGFDMMDLVFSSELICFAVLCILNISAIDLWEHASRFADPEVKATDELALTLPLTLLGAASLIFALKDHDLTTRPFFYAILTGAALLQVLNRTRSRFQMDALRVLADVALIVPLLVFIASSKN